MRALALSAVLLAPLVSARGLALRFSLAIWTFVKSQDTGNRSRSLLSAIIPEWRRDDEGRTGPPTGVAAQQATAARRPEGQGGCC